MIIVHTHIGEHCVICVTPYRCGGVTQSQRDRKRHRNGEHFGMPTMCAMDMKWDSGRATRDGTIVFNIASLELL